MRIHYEPYVAESLGSSYEVRGPATNSQSSRHLLANLDEWVLSRLSSGSVVHVNAGGHDVRRVPDDDWTVQVSLDEYRSNMAGILDRLAGHDFVGPVMVATTMPVDEERHRSARYSIRLNADIVEYNAVIVDLARERRMPVNDLWSFASHLPFDPLSGDGVHLTERGRRAVGVAVAGEIRRLT